MYILILALLFNYIYNIQSVPHIHIEFEPASTELSNSTAEPEAVLQNVNPAVILAISSNNTPSGNSASFFSTQLQILLTCTY
ncbi:hypothetical protein EB796_024472 [Bugula neritina]|uniref:Uncharacterized protein n=1 Tax=Bugula neritina TaxID=10212 RepID=A0A7J7IV00_BUGNE|nr:hypothetical protein EB796_024472 [Bugula neritina]